LRASSAADTEEDRHIDTARWERLQQLFHDAAERPAAERRAFLDAACHDDPALVPEVLSLLEADEDGHALLDRDLADVARDVLDGGVPSALRTLRFGPYRILDVLGEGGMGVVYRAVRDDLGSVAALKILRDAWLSPARRERFASEQRTLAQLNHPSIAHLYDANSLPDGTPWFVMEYVEGVPLTDYCRAHSSSFAERIRLFRAVCEAVLHAHTHAIIHRDLKPSNILVKEDGSVKLLDFGIAKHLEAIDSPADRTRTGLRLMTPAYAAPEQVRGDRVGLHTDVYSLGIILYELLTGRLPFDLTHRTPSEAEIVIAEFEAVKPSAVARATATQAGAPAGGTGGVSWADLDVLCLTAMHKDPERRYRTVEALIRDVDHYLGGEPLEARADSMGYRLNKFVRRNTRGVVAGALALLALVSIVVFYTVRVASARNAAEAEAARAQRIQGFMLSLFQGGDEDAGPAESLRVVTLVDRGVQEAGSLVGEPGVQAELLATLGGIYQQLGDLDRADSLLTAARDRRSTLHGTAHPDVAESNVALGLLRSDQARFDDAEQLVRNGLTHSRKELPADHPVVARATAALGHVLVERGAYDSAVPILEEAVRIYSAPGDVTPALSNSLYELANTHFYLGHWDIADSLTRRVLAMSRALHGDRHPSVAEDLINLGAIQFEAGHYAEAERYYREALAINTGWYGQDSHVTASTLTMLGRAMVREEKFDEATDALQQALAIQERVFGPVHPRVASAVNELGTVSLQRNKLDDAEAAFRRMADIYAKVYPGGHYLTGTALSNLASVYMSRKEPAKAEPLYRQAIVIYSTAQSPEHLNTGIARIKLGRSLLRQGRFAEAAQESFAGYEIVSRQADPAVSFLKNARKDLVAAYDSLGEPGKAARFRAELADTLPKTATAVSQK
jgi:serine/threonine-protein kinase